MEKLRMKLIAEEFEKEEFYEEIQAPKFVDLTLPDPFIPDDRYWFCSRVGCDLKHEQEIDLEAIYKNFALRAMAARSPNMKLRKILSNRQSENRKCPLSAPPKSSKSRIPKLPLLSSVSRRLIDAKEATKPPPKPGPTPKPRVKHVAAKYMTMTTPRVKKLPSDVVPFKSVRNQPTASSRIPRQRLVAAKALNFASPKKIVRAKALECQSETTPLKRLCEGMKKLEITDKKRGVNGGLQRTRKKQNGVQEVKGNSSRCLTTGKTKGSVQRKAKPVVCDIGVAKPESDEGISGSSDGVSDETPLSASNLSEESDKERVLVKSGGPQVDVHYAENKNKSEGNRNDRSPSGDEKENAPVSNEAPLSALDSSQESEGVLEESLTQVDVQMAEDGGKNEGSKNNQSSSGDEKENTPFSDTNKNLATKNGESGTDLGAKHEAPKKTKAALTEGKSSLKENCPAVKHKKQKTTNPKPFRLRTDERWILKEATLERRQQLEDENQISVSKTEGKIHNKSKKNQVAGCCKLQNKDGQKRVKSSARLPFLQISDQRATQRLKVSRPKPEGERANKSHVKRPTTIPETPKFHALHVPRSCTKNMEKGIAA